MTLVFLQYFKEILLVLPLPKFFPNRFNQSIDHSCW